MVLSRLVLVAATWICWINYRSGFVGMLVLHFLLLLNLLLIVKKLSAYFTYCFLFSIGNTLIDANLNCLNWFHFLIIVGGLLVILISCRILGVSRMSMSTVFFFVQLGKISFF